MNKDTVKVDRELLLEAYAATWIDYPPLARKLKAILDAPPAKNKAEKQRDRLLVSLREASDEFHGFPHSLGYDITHCEKYEALIAQIEAEIKEEQTK